MTPPPRATTATSRIAVARSGCRRNQELHRAYYHLYTPPTYPPLRSPECNGMNGTVDICNAELLFASKPTPNPKLLALLIRYYIAAAAVYIYNQSIVHQYRFPPFLLS